MGSVLALALAAGCRGWTGAHVELTTAAAVTALSEAEAGRSRPVRLTGAVTYQFSPDPRFLLEDASGSITLDTSAANAPAGTFDIGNEVTLSGYTWRTPSETLVVVRDVRTVAGGRLPTPQRVTGADLKAGRHAGRWVEAEGVVHTARIEQDGQLITGAEHRARAGRSFASAERTASPEAHSSTPASAPAASRDRYVRRSAP